MSRDVHFTPHGCYRGYGAAVARSAVLYQLAGTPQFVATEKDQFEPTIAASSISVLIHWRQLIDALGRHGWPASESVVSYMRNCASAFVVARPLTKVCKYHQICPHCYARSVIDTWKLFDRIMPNDRYDEFVSDDVDELDGPVEERNYPYHLLERRSEAFVPLTQSVEHRQIAANHEKYKFLDKHVFDRLPRDPDEVELSVAYLRNYLSMVPRARSTMLRSVGAVGGYASVSVEPWGECWHVEHRSLMIIPNDSYGDLYLPRPDHGTMTRHHHPTRKVIAGAVSRVCAYSKRWMVGDPSLTAIMLKARQSLRLSAVYGNLRKRGPNDES